MIHRICFATCCLLLAVATVARSQETSPPVKPKRVTPSLPAGVAQRLDVVYARYGDRELHLDLFSPTEKSPPRPAVVVVHGGGWLNGDKTKFHALAQALAQRGYVAAAIEYRLGGEALFPAAIHDCNAATRWLRANAERLGIDAKRIAAVGGSAGGHLVGLMAAAPSVDSLQGEGGNSSVSSRLAAAVVMAGPLELATGPVAEKSRNSPESSNSNRWLGKTVDEAPELYRLASPLTHVSKECPPILFQTGEHDRPQRNVATRDKLRELGVSTETRVYADGKHGCWNQHPWFEPMVDDIDAFLARHLKIAPSKSALLWQELPWGEVRRVSDRLELVVLKRPADGIVSIPRLNNPIEKAFLADDKKQTPLSLKPGVGEWSIVLPPQPERPTVVVETVGRPYLPTIRRIVSAAADGEIGLAAHDAVTHGKLLRYEPQPHKNTVGYWANEADWCEWQFYCERPGDYEVHILQGCGKGQGGSEVAVAAGEQRLTFTVEDTGHFQNFKERSVGKLSLAAGVHTLEVRPVKKAAKAVMDVRRIRLVPVGGSS